MILHTQKAQKAPKALISLKDKDTWAKVQDANK